MCSNGLVCPEKQRCDTTWLFSNRGQQNVIQCVCVTGYNGPECPAPYSAPPAATVAPLVPAGEIRKHFPLDSSLFVELRLLWLYRNAGSNRASSVHSARAARVRKAYRKDPGSGLHKRAR